jgi:two-component sensor histidine kinase/PAS domain-containing protein
MDDVVYSYDEAYKRCHGLTEADVSFLKAVDSQMSIVADVSRADILLYGRLGIDRAIVLSHARPHSISSIYDHLSTGREVGIDQEPMIIRTLTEGRPQQGGQLLIADSAPIMKQVYPLRQPGQKQVIGAFSVETNLLEHERHRRRRRAFRQALLRLQMMALRAQVNGAEDLSPFGEHDGIIVTDRDRVIRYVSGIATNLYRRIGYSGDLLRHNLSDLETEDDDLARAALRQRRCLEQEEKAGGRYWVKKAIPLLDLSYPRLFPWINRNGGRDAPSHVILLVRDTTEARRRDQELRVKTAMIQEVHHRVKNNLQTIAALLRMQVRRMHSEEARTAVEDAISRILSVAVIHEFLSNQESRIINIKDVSNRIITMMRQQMLGPDQKIELELEGPPIYLPARQATACALVINELLQNAVEHGFEEGSAGTVSLRLQDEGNTVIVRVQDDGIGFPDNFSIEHAESLGLQIVQTLVKEDLSGTIEMRNGDGAEAIVTFPKAIFGGEEGWTAHV